MNSIIIAIAGGTGSGKSYLTRNLANTYPKKQILIIEQDSYYKDISNLDYEDRCKQNFDHPDAIDIELFNQQLISLVKGQTIEIPIYDFSTHSRSKDTKTIHPHCVIIVEGILTLHYAILRELMDIKIFVDTPDDIRFIRRLSRDIDKRNRTVNSVIEQYLKTVRPMHKQFVEPSKYFADIIIPEGSKNKVAIDLIRTKINSILIK